ncbi:hypothetical protein EXIGLDRAFT_836575 [Exidia glandulosa HHB12029]|uniref:GSKIP domain-containing protein n=1 Tax=Exidia glandulosa HHB12029 TaxID=1314781 RepID=A0A165HPW4_EXIGL|nr:hypothetical protein EXIGLDRAFT_836575 [Exidia glandulosa HHB12029]
MDATFYGVELDRALKEQRDRIRSSDISASTSHEAVAAIEPLEGVKLAVKLSIAGYEVTGRDAQPYETLDALLHAESPLYADTGMSTLFSKLEQVRVERADF